MGGIGSKDELRHEHYSPSSSLAVPRQPHIVEFSMKYQICVSATSMETIDGQSVVCLVELSPMGEVKVMTAVLALI